MLAVVLVLLGIGNAIAAAPLRAEPAPLLIPLQCRLGNGPWQDCQMRVEQVGSHWWLLVGPQTLEFLHDGRGSVTMQENSSGWRAVSSRWQEDTSLCWDGVCARGEIPLD